MPPPGRSQPPRPSNASVIDITEETFQAEVLDRSFQVPVLLDLWADWCEPCKQLSPILERLAGESGGRWILAKIDVDANPRISQALQVQSIPTVFAVLGGQLVPGFQGALPEPQVREFVAACSSGNAGRSEWAPTGTGEDDEAGNAAEVDEVTAAAVAPEPSDPRFAAAETALEVGDYAAAAAAYDAILASEPANEQARLALLQVQLLERTATLDERRTGRGRCRSGRCAGCAGGRGLFVHRRRCRRRLPAAADRADQIAADDRGAIRDRLIEYFELIGPPMIHGWGRLAAS